jgi:N-acetyl sugar amidotransferase
MFNRTQCSKCVMDKSAEEITFNKKGVCNFCEQAQKSLKEIKEGKLDISKIKGKKYDCLIGLSGGVDSSMVLHHAVKMGLKPICFSLDNGWNTEKADENVRKLVNKLGVKHIIYKIDLEKYRELQSAFLKRGIKNAEAPTDHILFAVTYELANKYGIKYILTGGNVATESIMPASWGEDPRDLKWIKAVYKSVTGKKLIGIPTISLLKEQYYRLIKRIKFVRLLDFIGYNRQEAIELLHKEYGFQDYGEKHCENTWTWWFQNFYLFEKWGIDKRKAHLSSLINSGQITRQQALEVLNKGPVFPFIGLEKKVLAYPYSKYEDYPNSKKIRQWVVKLYKWIPKKWK